MNRWNDRENHVLSEYAISFSERLISKTLYGIKQKLASLWITQNPLGIFAIHRWLWFCFPISNLEFRTEAKTNFKMTYSKFVKMGDRRAII